MVTNLRATAALVSGALMLTVGVLAQAPPAPKPEAQRISDATTVFSSVMSAEDKTIPRAVLEKAQGIVVFPYVPAEPSLRGQGPNTRRQINMSGVRARGVLSVKGDNGAWSAPAFVSLTGGGRRTGDLVLVAMTRRGLDRLVSGGQVALDADGVATGSLGAAQTAPEIAPGTEILSFSRLRGHTADVPLDNSMIQHDLDANKSFYGKALTPPQAVAQSSGPEPVAAWRAALEKHIDSQR